MKGKLSKIKRNNQKKNKLIKQGKIKSKKLKHKQINIQNEKNQLQQAAVYSDEEESDHGEDLLGMIEKDDLKFLKQSIASQSYSILKKIRITDPEDKPIKIRKRKHRENENDDFIENKYENDLSQTGPTKKVKMMLPLKTKHGIIEQTIELDEEPESMPDKIFNSIKNDGANLNEDSDLEIFDVEDADELDKTRPLSTAELLAHREKAMNSIKEKVGVICSGMLEDPEGKITNVRLLFNLMDHCKPEVYLSTKKLISISLLEVFKDILPAYPIREQDTKDVKLKKDTLKLIKYEDRLLQAYKTYLQKLEKILLFLTPKKGNTVKRTAQELKAAEVAVFCMCDLLISHPYFNYAKNIVQVIVPLSNNRFPNIRQMICNAIKQIFKDDKRGEITLTIMRKINVLVKSKANELHSDILGALLSLKIKEVNLDQEKEQNLKEKKLNAHKQRVLQLSRKERKRKKKLEELNKELLETQAEESKFAKQKLYTEITKILFTIYFRILKQYPNSKILSVTLEGLAKFAHCINLDFYTDLVNVINNLLEQENLGYREQLHCVLTVITILSGQGDVLNIDPLRFYSHLYKNLTEFHAGHSHKDYSILIETLEMVLVKRRRKMSVQRLAAFTKRLAILALVAMHNSSLACLSFIKTLLQLTKAIDILLDCDWSVGDGNYLPFSDDPEYANASNSALWELSLLMQHYHPTVRKMAQYIAAGVPSSGESSLPPDLKKLSANELFIEYNSEQMAFKPAVPPPKKCSPTAKVVNSVFVNESFEKYCRDIFNKSVPMHYFYIE